MRIYGRSTALPLTSPASRLAAAAFFALLTAVCARVYFHLWFTPVPVTLQVFGVILSGLALGSRLGAASQLQYLMMGAMGLPVFSGMVSGPAAFAGPTGGYLFGFVAGAYVSGRLFERFENKTRTAALVAGVGGMLAIYALGAPWLAVWLGLSGKPVIDCVRGAWLLGVVPFIGIDLLKALAASVLALGGRLGRGLEVFRNL